MIPIQINSEGFTIPVRVTPRASKNSIERFREGDEVIRIKTTAVPESGKANESVQKLLSEALSIRKSAVFVIQGGFSTE